MPWCPKCKVEYQDGYTECTDCKTTLVESLEEVEVFEPFFQAEDKKVAEKLLRFFEYSDLKCELSYDEVNELYVVAIPPKKEVEAKKLYEAFYFVEYERLQKGSAERTDSEAEESDEEASDADNSDSDNSDSDVSEESQDMEAPSPTEDEDYKTETPSDDISGYERNNDDVVYVMKADQYKDLTGTVWIFLAFGVIGLIFVLLNVTKIFHVFNGWIPNTVMGVLFLFFIYIALSTNKKAKMVQAEIDEENKHTEEINSWLKQNVTESFLASIHSDELTEEANYIKAIDVVKEKLIKEFGPLNFAYLDRLIDEYYDNTFDKE